MLGSLLAPLRVPERVMVALTEAGRELGLIRSEVTRVREQTEPLAELLPALERLESGLDARLASLHDVVAALESEESFLNKTVNEMTRELREVHEILAGLQDDIQRITEHLPEGRGPLQKVRDVLTSSDDD